MDDHDTDEGFFSRWSRRKSARRDGREPPEPLTPAAQPPVPSAVQPPAPPPSPVAVSAPPQGAALAEGGRPASASDDRPAPRPAPTLDDVAALTKDSDFSAFTRPDVDPAVRNAALKKLFHAEPQFNVMDGLDVYIDDYHTPQPLPRAIMRQMLQARAMGLLDDELKEQDLPAGDPAAALAHAGPGPSASVDTAPCDEDPDLQLQPNDAAAAGRAGNGPGEAAGGLDDPGGDGRG